MIQQKLFDAPSDEESTAQHNPRKKLKKSNHDMQYYVQYLSNKVELKDP